MLLPAGPFGQPMMHNNRLHTVMFSPDGKTVLTLSYFKEPPRFWDAATGQPIGQPMQPPGGVVAVAFSPDGKTILTASNEDAVRKWDVPAMLPDDVARLSTWMATVTGLELDDQGSIHLLDELRTEE